MFVNCTNHRSSLWEKEQLEAAGKWGEIVDVPFPDVPAGSDERQVTAMAEQILKEIEKLQPQAVMCHGEWTLAYQLITGLKARGIKVLAACSERIVEEEKLLDGSIGKKSRFHFVRFREYC